jgi:hypothetical protein
MCMFLVGRLRSFLHRVFMNRRYPSLSASPVNLYAWPLFGRYLAAAVGRGTMRSFRGGLGAGELVLGVLEDDCGDRPLSVPRPTLGRWQQVHDLLGIGTALIEAPAGWTCPSTRSCGPPGRRGPGGCSAPFSTDPPSPAVRDRALRSPPLARPILWALPWLFPWAGPCGQHPGVRRHWNQPLHQQAGTITIAEMPCQGTTPGTDQLAVWCLLPTVVAAAADFEPGRCVL